MKKHLKGSFRVLQSLGIIALPAYLVSLNLAFDPAFAQLVGGFERPQENEMYNTLPGSAQQGTILDATNPMDLMNRLRRASAMEDATDPQDAIDKALKAFEVDQQTVLD